MPLLFLICAAILRRWNWLFLGFFGLDFRQPRLCRYFDVFTTSRSRCILAIDLILHDFKDFLHYFLFAAISADNARRYFAA